MACQPCHTPGSISVEAYKRHTTGTGKTFQERQRRRVNCPECGVEVTAGSLLTHCQIQHGVGWGDREAPPPRPRESQTYRVYSPKHMLRLWCPVEGCMGGDSNQTNLRVQFAHRHVRDTIVILEEGNLPYPRCPMCDMFVSHNSLNSPHLATAFYEGEMRGSSAS